MFWGFRLPEKSFSCHLRWLQVDEFESEGRRSPRLEFIYKSFTEARKKRIAASENNVWHELGANICIAQVYWVARLIFSSWLKAHCTNLTKNAAPQIEDLPSTSVGLKMGSGIRNRSTPNDFLYPVGNSYSSWGLRAASSSRNGPSDSWTTFRTISSRISCNW